MSLLSGTLLGGPLLHSTGIDMVLVVRSAVAQSQVSGAPYATTTTLPAITAALGDARPVSAPLAAVQPLSIDVLVSRADAIQLPAPTTSDISVSVLAEVVTDGIPGTENYGAITIAHQPSQTVASMIGSTSGVGAASVESIASVSSSSVPGASVSGPVSVAHQVYEAKTEYVPPIATGDVALPLLFQATTTHMPAAVIADARQHILADAVLIPVSVAVIADARQHILADAVLIPVSVAVGNGDAAITALGTVHAAPATAQPAIGDLVIDVLGQVSAAIVPVIVIADAQYDYAPVVVDTAIVPASFIVADIPGVGTVCTVRLVSRLPYNQQWQQAEFQPLATTDNTSRAVVAAGSGSNIQEISEGETKVDAVEAGCK